MRARIGIVGGGAAGIFAALGARVEGADAVIYERNPRLGIKILISGGGKCNITHDGTPAELEEGFIPREARFLRYALHEVTPADVLDLLHGEGVETFTRPNGRVFPTSGRAEDVLGAFERALERAGAEIRTRARVEGIQVEDERAVGIVVDGVVEPCDAVVVATGGTSYRKVGTTGDGIEWGRELGLEIVPVRAALAPIYFPTPPPADWQGVALRDVLLRAVLDGAPLPFLKKDGYIAEWRGDLLLTHRGVSGPTVLEVSRIAALMAESGAAPSLVVDLLPDVSPGELLERWEERLAASGRTEVQTFVEGIAPRAVVPAILDAAGVQSGTKVSSVTRAGRTSLLATLKGWIVGLVGEIPIDRGEVTAGGIALTEVSPRTMQARRVGALYVAGEALDIAGSVGGYNLQAAFATGYVAGRSAACAALERSTRDRIASA
jgi:predicted Rossmann fold flavoprotein